MIGTTSILSRYIGRQFILHFAVMMLVILGLMFMFDAVETLRRASHGAHVPAGAVISMAFMKLPYLAQRVMPMAVLFTAMYSCWKLNKTSELIVIRSFGHSAWQFLSPQLFIALAIGVLSTAALNPVSAILLSKHEQISNTYFQTEHDLVTVSKTGLWLRQPTDEGYALLHAAGFDWRQWRLNDAMLLFFDNDDQYLRRMESGAAYLRNGYWEITAPRINDKTGMTKLDASRRVPTNLTAEKIEESFADPETISFWNIPEYINIMEDTGFPATRLYIHFQSLLAQPFMMAAMVLLAAAFSLRPPRFGGAASLIALGVAAGFLVFFLESILQAFGASQKIPAGLAAWTPAAVALLLGTTALLHLEDG